MLPASLRATAEPAMLMLWSRALSVGASGRSAPKDSFVRGPRPRITDVNLSSDQRETLIWICILVATNQFGFGAIIPVVPLYAQSFGVSETAVGLTIAIYGLARFAVNVPAGQFAGRAGRRPLLALGGTVTVIGNILTAFAPDYLLFLCARFISGAGAAMVLTGGQAVLADISRPTNRGRVMAIYQGVFLFAVGAGPLPGGFLADQFGLTAPFIAAAALAAGVALLAWFRVPETRGQFGRLITTPGQARPLSLRRQLILLRAIPGFALIGLVSFSIFFARTGALFNVVPLDAEARLHLSPQQIGFGLSLISVVGLILAYPSGMLVDRFGRKAVIVPASLLTATSMMLFAIVPSWSWFVVASIVWAAASGIGGAAPAAYVADIAPAKMTASALGTYRMLADAGYVVGPLVLGIAADLVSPAAALGLASIIVAATGIAFALRAPETMPAPP